MKTIRMTFVILTIFLTSCYTYKLASIDQPFVKVYANLPGNKTELYIKANDWMIKKFNNALSVIQFSDKDEGVIIGKYLMHGSGKVNEVPNVELNTFAKIYIALKDNKAMIKIEPMSSWNYDPSSFINSYSKDKCLADMEALCSDLNNYLNIKGTEF